ncbi:MAG: glycosyltransferase family 9 protein [Bacteroidia bacterium]|nr:glycosyltransferase family 9 protein [Bacteroidia bacterium]
MGLKKVLIIRFSSIGDIVLTSPVPRSLKKSHPDYEVHFLSKKAHKDLLLHNPHIDKLHILKDSLGETIQELKQENFDYILDLHHNLRSFLIKLRLGVKASSFPKENWAKYKMVRFKNRKIKLRHIVERYADTLSIVGSQLDHEGLDFFVPEGLEEKAQNLLSEQLPQVSEKPLAIVLGAKHATKRWPASHFIELIEQLGEAVVLIGGPDAKEEAEEISKFIQTPLYNSVGHLSLLESAALLKQCRAVVAHDTGFMHIAAAFQMDIYSLWGNTVPEFGMTPYKSPHQLLEIRNLDCRPCSKIGFDQCPKGHFACMKQQKAEKVAERIKGGMPKSEL